MSEVLHGEGSILHVLAIDPSTDIVGVALVAVHRCGKVTATCSAFNGFELTSQPKSRSDLRSRLDRIAAIRSAMTVWIRDNVPGIDVVAYEQQTERGHYATEAINMATGAFLCLPRLSGVPLEGVARVSACAATGASAVYREKAGTTSAEKTAKKKRLKEAVIVGVNELCGLALDPTQDAEADAIAVGVVAGRKVWAEKAVKEKKASQGTLPLRKAPARKSELSPRKAVAA